MASSNVCWGVEVGSGAVKALKLERDGDSVRVVDFVIIPHKRVLSTPDIDQIEATRLALGALTSQIGDDLKSSTVAMSVPGHAAFARFAKLPPVEQKGVGNLVRFEAVQQIPFPIEEVEWDYQTFMSDDSPDIEVGIFAITRERINDLLHQWGDVGLVPDYVTLSPVAAYNAIAYDLAFTEKTPGTIILDIGTTATDLVIAEAGKVWIRTFPLGGHNFTEALTSAFKLNYAKAERAKREVETLKNKRAHVLSALKPILGDLVQDVQRSISYYEDTHPDANLTRLVGVGSSFRLFGLRKLLSQQLQMDVYRLDQFKRISVEGSGAADFQSANLNLATAYGLALQGLGFNAIDANLIPTEVVRKSIWARKTPWFAAAAALGIVGGGLSFLRPFADSNAIAAAKNDNDSKRIVSETVNLGRQLKNEADAMANDPTLHPSKDASQIRDLMENRTLYPLLVNDLYAIFDDAEAKKSRLADIGDDPVFTLHEFTTEYVAPDGTIGRGGGSAAAEVPSFPGMPGGRGNDAGAAASASEGDADASGTVEKAGPQGAVRITLVVETPNAVLPPFMHDSVERWLLANADRADLPYRLVNIPAAQDMQVENIRIGTAPDAAPTSTPATSAPNRGPRGGDAAGSRGADPRSSRSLGSGRTPAPAARDGGFTRPGFESGGGRPTPGTPGRPGQGSRPASVDTSELDGIAPLAPRRNEGPKSMKRYTITWVALVRPPASPNSESSASAG